MQWQKNYDGPIYLQLAHQLEVSVASGQYEPGSRLPGVRELAETAKVNPNTMQRALVELEQRGLVYTQGTSGRFITDDINCIQDMRKSLATAKMTECIIKMNQLGFTDDEIKTVLEELIKEKNS